MSEWPSGHYDKETGLIKVSWSKIKTHEECRQKALRVAEGRKSPGRDVRIFFPGNVVDMAMRRWLSMDNPPRFWMADHIEEIMAELLDRKDDGIVRWLHTKDREEVTAFCRDAAFRLEELLRQFALPFDYQPALRFSTPMIVPGLEEGTTVKILLNGEMDLLVKEKDWPLPDITPDLNPVTIAMADIARRPRLHLWDLKVTVDADYWRKTVAQLVFYDIVCICMFGVPVVEAGLLQPMVDDRPYISFVPSDQDRTEMFTRIETVVHNILRMDHTPKADTAGCGWCDVRHACDKYATEPGTNVVPLF
jgi:hypothetical protein